MTKLLINESPLQVLPTLANLIGLNEAIVLQQLHYWLQNPKLGKIVDDKKWFRNSMSEWHNQNFNFWSESTIYRIFNKLEEIQLVISRSDINQKKYDRTKWYTIQYDMLDSLCQNNTPILSDCLDAIGQFDGMQSVNLTTTIPKTSSKTSSKNIPDSKESGTPFDFQQSEIIVESKSEQEIKDQMNAVGVIDLLDMLDENNKEEISNTNLTADSKHPAIIAWRNVNKRYPKKDLYEFVANGLGSNPNEDILKYVCQKWKASGYNPTNIDGQIDWYKQAVTWYKAGNSLDSFSPRYNNFVTKDNNEFTGTLRGLTFE